MSIQNKHPIGEVIEPLAAGRFRVRMKSDGRELTAYLSGKIRKNKIQITVGDSVEVVLDPSGGENTNRIVWRR